MTDRRCECPACVAAAAKHLLETGRPAMALNLLQDLPERIQEALEAAYNAGRADARKPAKPAPQATTKQQQHKAPKAERPAFANVAAELRAHVARLGSARVAAALGVRVADLGDLLEGRVGLTKTALEKLRQLDDDDPPPRAA